MKDNRTLIQRIRHENKVRLKLIPLGFNHKGDMRFERDTLSYDLSATDIDKFAKEWSA